MRRRFGRSQRGLGWAGGYVGGIRGMSRCSWSCSYPTAYYVVLQLGTNAQSYPQAYKVIHRRRHTRLTITITGPPGDSAVSMSNGGGKQLSGLVPPEAYGSRTALGVVRIPAPATVVVAQALVVHDRAVASVAEILVVWVVGWCVFHT